MQFPNAPDPAHLDFYATMYEHYNQLMLSKAPTDIDGLVFRTLNREHYQQQFIDAINMDQLAEQIGLTKIGNIYAKA